MINNEFLDGISNSFSSIKNAFSEVWSGTCATVANNAITNITSLINSVNEKISRYNSALDKLTQYKANTETIKRLQQQIAALSSEKKPDYAQINSLQARVNELISENENLKTEISNICNNITPINIKTKNNNMIAHRGAYWNGHRDFIENTAERFHMAGAAGYWGCETDVRYDNNGTLVCSHNAVQGSQQTTTFEEYLDICKEYNMTPIIDLKYDFSNGSHNYLSKDIINTINEKGMMDSCIIQTTEAKDVKRIREYSNDARIWYLTTQDVNKTIDLANEYNVEAINYASGVSSQTIKRVTDNGIEVCVYNVQTEKSKELYEYYGAKYIMTDNQIGLNNETEN